jgi:DNA-binding LytR/AlgR family response regulator
MFDNQPILIVEDEPLIAMCLADTVECMKGLVVGPAASVKEALVLIERHAIAAAILDANLSDRDITPVALLLTKLRVPFIVHTAVGLPAGLARIIHKIRVVLKPQTSEFVVDQLRLAILRTRGPSLQQV